MLSQCISLNNFINVLIIQNTSSSYNYTYNTTPESVGFINNVGYTYVYNPNYQTIDFIYDGDNSACQYRRQITAVEDYDITKTQKLLALKKIILVKNDI